MNIWDLKKTVTDNERKRINLYSKMMHKWLALFLSDNQYHLIEFAHEMAYGYFGKLKTMLYELGVEDAYNLACNLKEMAWKSAWYVNYGEVIVSR